MNNQQTLEEKKNIIFHSKFYDESELGPINNLQCHLMAFNTAQEENLEFTKSRKKGSFQV